MIHYITWNMHIRFQKKIRRSYKSKIRESHFVEWIACYYDGREHERYSARAQAAQAWDAIYKTSYESLTRFRKLLENAPRYKNNDDLPFCRCVRKRSGCFWGCFERFLSFHRWNVKYLIPLYLPTVKTQNRWKRPRNTQNAQEHNDNEVNHLYF